MSIAGFGNTEPLSSRDRKGKDCHYQDKQDKTSRYKGLVLGLCLVPKIDVIFFEALIVNSVLV